MSTLNNAFYAKEETIWANVSCKQKQQQRLLILIGFVWKMQTVIDLFEPSLHRFAYQNLRDLSQLSK